MSTADLLAEGIAAARAGRTAEAQATLLKVLEADDRNESAWLWLSGLFEAPTERRVCLENVLAINPANAHARRGLAMLDQAQPPPSPRATVVLGGNPLAQTLTLPAADPSPTPDPAAVARHSSVVTTGPTSGRDAPPLPASASVEPAVSQAPRAPATSATVPLNPAAASLVLPAPPPPLPVDAPPPEPTLRLPDPALAASENSEPCPYCGAPTTVAHRRCPTCRKSLLVGGVRREERSVFLKILVGLYALSTVGLLAGGMLQVAGLAAIGAEVTSRGGGGGWVPALGAAIGVLIGTAFYAWFTLSLWQRKTWAYIFHWVGLGFNLLGSVILVVFVVTTGSALAGASSEVPAESRELFTGMVGAIAGVLAVVAFCNLVIGLAWLALTVACHGDFFGRKVRISTAGATSEGDLYNAGLVYSKRGMWFMAAHEWELAARGAPRDLTVRRALGLAYARLGRHEQARDQLCVALSIAPGDPQLTDDLALVEKLAAKARSAGGVASKPL